MPSSTSPTALPALVLQPQARSRLQGIDNSLVGAPRLYLASNAGASCERGAAGLPLAADDWLGSGTLRNSFFVAPWVELSRARSLALVVEASGSLRLRVMRASPGHPAEVLAEVHVDSPVRSQHVLPLGSLSSLPVDSRLFWHIDAIEDGCLHQAAWCTRDAPRADTRLASASKRASAWPASA